VVRKPHTSKWVGALGDEVSSLLTCGFGTDDPSGHGGFSIESTENALAQECGAASLGLLGRGRVNHVNFDFMDVVGREPGQVGQSHPLRKRGTELVDGESKAGTEHN